MSKKNDIRRLADATERIATALEKLAGGAELNEPQAKTVDQTINAGRLDRSNSRAERYHAIRPGPKYSGKFFSACVQGGGLIDVSPAREVQPNLRCGHNACRKLFALADTSA